MARRALGLICALAMAAAAMGQQKGEQEHEQNDGQAGGLQRHDPWGAAGPLFAEHCGRCHGERRPKGGVVLVPATVVGVRRDGDLWTGALRQVEFGNMPPASRKKQPTREERQQMVAALRHVLTTPDPDAPADPGRPTVRRLSRTAYANTVRDLLGVKVDVAEIFPADAQAYGFDTVGDTLFVPPMLLEKYADAARLAVEKARFTGLGALYLLNAGAVLPDVATQTQVLEKLLRRAFRRPPTASEVASRLAIVRGAIDADRGWRSGWDDAVQSVLLSPHFLFRIEADRDDAGDQPWPISDHELAVRLSYFLWSTMPDRTLDQLADEGRLRDDDVLAAQVERMLDDPKATALADDFGAQWLGYGRVRDMAVDFRRFPEFRELRDSMVEEATRFFRGLVVDDRSLLDLLDADYTYVNGALAAHYGVPVQDRGWQRVTLTDRRRGGVLGMAATLAATSDPLRTNPVRRGAWVLDKLLGMEAPPPPADAGTLPEDDRQKDGLTLRQRLEQHRADPRCASCHAHLDPFGLALENFDGIGAWRDEDQGKPVAADTVLPDGTAVDGVVELKEWLRGQEERFVRSAVRQMFTYALGRPPTYVDEGALSGIQADLQGDLAQRSYRLRALVHAIVRSYPFQHRRR